LERSKANLFHLGADWNKLDAEARARYSDRAFRDSAQCLDMYPNWNHSRLIHAQNTIFEAHRYSDATGFRFVMAEMDEMLRENSRYAPLTAAERSFATNCRAQCHAFLGETDEAERDYSESIVLAPDERRWYTNRADFWDKNGRPDLARKDRLDAEKLNTLFRALSSGIRWE